MPYGYGKDHSEWQLSTELLRLISGGLDTDVLSDTICACRKISGYSEYDWQLQLLIAFDSMTENFHG